MSVAQLVEHWSPKPGVRGSSPLRRANGSMAQRQLHLTVNQASFEFVGSSPTAGTKYKSICLSGLKGRSAKPLFVGSNPTVDSKYMVSVVQRKNTWLWSKMSWVRFPSVTQNGSLV